MTHQGLFASVPIAVPQLTPLIAQPYIFITHNSKHLKAPTIKCSLVHQSSCHESPTPTPTNLKLIQISKFLLFQVMERNSSYRHKFREIFITVPILLLRKMGLLKAIIYILSEVTELIQGKDKSVSRSPTMPHRWKRACCKQWCFQKWSPILVPPTALF